MKCLTHPKEEFDIAIIGVPFDTAVSYRPGKFYFCFCSAFKIGLRVMLVIMTLL